MGTVHKIKGLAIYSTFKTVQKYIAKALLALTISAIPASAACRHALVLALDVSGSVNEDEYALQIEGVASALLSPEVRELILEQPEAPISIAIFEWSSDKHQQIIQNWVEIASSATLAIIANTVRSHYKDRATLKTSIGSALYYAKALLDQKATCWQQTIDVSGDGANNDGKTPRETYSLVDFNRITVNALVIAQENVADKQNIVALGRARLQTYFDTHVIHGPAAFSMLAIGYRDYERALIEKLLRELSAPIVGTNHHNLPEVRKKPL